MKILFIFFFFFQNIFAQEELICSVLTAKKHYKEVQNLQYCDKTKHCTLSCYMGLSCDNSEAYLLGVLKEVYDFFGPGDSDHKDIEANVAGLRISELVLDKSACLKTCSRLYD